jgi:MOSC domain-containing protein YiiM
MIPLIHSIRCGPVAELSTGMTGEWWDKPWTSGFHKHTVEGEVRLGSLGLDGDAQADLIHHGGPDKAICVYPSEHFPYWRRELGIPDIGSGAFGENFTLVGLTETEVCIGDVFQVGTATVQVSQPRQPCWKLARRWRIKDLTLRVEQTGFTGWYFRVLEPGSVRSGDALKQLEQSFPQWTIEAANQVMHRDTQDSSRAAELASCPALSTSWKDHLACRVVRGRDESKQQPQNQRQSGG